MSTSVATLHEASARNDERCLDLRARHGAAGYGAYWMMIEMMRETNTFKLRKANIPAIAFGISIPHDDVNAIIATCINNGLFAEDDDHFWSPSLLRRMEKMEGISQKRKEAGKIGGEARAKHLLSKAKQKLSKGKENKIKIKDPSLEEGGTGETELTQFGEHVRMTEAEHAKLVETFGAAIVSQELPELDVWISMSDTPNAKKYRRPEHNHYLLARSTWLPGKKLRRVGETTNSKPAPRDFMESKAARQADVVERAQALRDAQERMISPRVKLEAK